MKKDQELAMPLNTFKNLHINLSAGELDIGWIILGLLNQIQEGNNYPHPMGGNIVLHSVHPSNSIFHTICQQQLAGHDEPLWEHSIVKYQNLHIFSFSTQSYGP